MIENINSILSEYLITFLLGLSYTFVLHSFVFISILPIYLFAYLYYRGKKNFNHITKQINAKVIYYVKFILSIAIVVLLIYYKYWNIEFFFLWKNPLMLYLVFFFSTIAASQFTVTNPVRKWVSYMAFTALFIYSLFFIYFFSLNQVVPENSKFYGMIGGIIFTVLIYFYDIFTTPKFNKKVESFELSTKEKRIKLNTLNLIIDVFGKYGDSSNFVKMSKQINDNLFKVTQSVGKRRIDDAEYLMLKIDLEVKQLENDIRERIFLLPAYLKIRLEDAKNDLETIKLEFAKFDKSIDITDLLNKCEILLKDIDTVTFRPEIIIDQINPYSAIFKEIENLNVSLRFLKNIDFELDSMLNEIYNSEIFFMLFDKLKLTNQNLNQKKNELTSLLEFYKNSKFKDINLQDIEIIFKILSDDFLKFRDSITSQKALLYKVYNHRNSEFGNNQIHCFIPKYCFSNKYVNGMIIWSTIEPYTGSLDLILNGVLVNFQSERNLKLLITESVYYTIKQFSFVGERVGMGQISILSNEDESLSEKLICDIEILPTKLEIIRDSLMIGLPFGVIIFLILQYIFETSQTYSTIFSSCFGLILSLIIFFARYYKSQNKFKY